METSPLVLVLTVGIVLLSQPLLRFGQPISFPSAIPFNDSSSTRHTLVVEDSGGGIFFWPLHQQAAISNLSFFSPDSTPMWYHSVCASYLGYVSNTTSEAAYVLSVVITGVEGGPRPENGMIVWMANRDKSARGVSPALSIDPDGILVLRGDNGEPVWWTGVTGDRLELQGDGNLLFYDSPGNVVWQSFDQPGDTLTLGQVLGEGTRLMSRASTRDFTWGSYSLLLDHDLRFSFYYSQDGNQDSIRYTRTGNIPAPCQPGLMGCAVVDFSLALSVSVFCDTKCSNDRSLQSWSTNFTTPLDSMPLPMASLSNETIPILRLLYNGDFVIYQCGRLSLWSPPLSFFATVGMAACELPTRCNRYTTCFPDNNTCSSGCTTEAGQSCMIGNDVPRPTCQNPSGWEMGTIASRSYVTNQYDTPIMVSDGQECRDLCYRNCSCTASFYNPTLGSCYLITERLVHLTYHSDSNYLAFIKIAPSPSSSSGLNRGSLVAIIAVSVSAMVVVASIVITVVIRKLHKPGCSGTKKTSMANIEVKPEPDDDDFLHESLHTTTRYSYQQIVTMTGGFVTMLGSGGFGPVYEGLLPNGNKVAVKKLDAMSRQGSKEFRAEVAIMAGIHHRNLVNLLGFYAEGLNKILVYEHMSNGSLDHWLFHSRKEEELVLTWARRFKIAVGVANGLAYLHEGCTKKIIHLDVKPQNILLDENFNAKVGDFGLSRLLSQEESFAMTTMRGTPGYLAPEWLQEGGVTEKIDIYSFGMVLLELVSGRKNLIMQQEDLDKRYFPSWAFDELKEGRDMEILDPKLVHHVFPKHKQEVEQGLVMQDHDVGDEVEQFKRVVNVAFVCIQEDPQCRPRMSCVAKMLEGEEMLPSLPLDHEIRRFMHSHAKSSSSCKNIDNFLESTTMTARSSVASHDM